MTFGERNQQEKSKWRCKKFIETADFTARSLAWSFSKQSATNLNLEKLFLLFRSRV